MMTDTGYARMARPRGGDADAVVPVKEVVAIAVANNAHAQTAGPFRETTDLA
jgi:hypothetical protein